MSRSENGEIFQAAREANVIVMSKDSAFLNLLGRHGPPPSVIWITCRNTSNRRCESFLGRRFSRPWRCSKAMKPL
uniref:DUF5615 family PIN-like protein n=1 Tax=Salisaeta longa TaxID=503170 RepID=UPI001B7FD9B0